MSNTAPPAKTQDLLVSHLIRDRELRDLVERFDEAVRDLEEYALEPDGDTNLFAITNTIEAAADVLHAIRLGRAVP